MIEPVLAGALPVHEYEPGSWGPPAAVGIVAGDADWHNPTLEDGAVLNPQRRA